MLLPSDAMIDASFHPRQAHRRISTHAPRYWGGTLAIVLALTACGGGSGNNFGPGAGGNDGSTGTGTVSSSTAGTLVIALSSTTVSGSTPGTVTAQVKRSDGSPVSGVIVSFATTGGKGTVTPDAVITDSTGTAAAVLTPVNGAIGAGLVTAVTTLPGAAAALTTQTAFTVTSIAVTLSSLGATPVAVDAYGSSVLAATVAGASVAAPVTVNFSSTCASAGKATLSPSQVSVTGTNASVTYQDKGCGGADRVTANIVGTSQQQSVDLSVLPPTAQSIEYVSSQPAQICLKGSGCPISSNVTFRLRDQLGNPVTGRDVAFALDIPNVANLSLTSAKTDADGLAVVAVTAKTTPAPVRVRATAALTGQPTLTTVSNQLVINAGLPTNRTISFAVEKLNPDGSFDGTTSTIRLQLNDRFGNPVPDGTSVSLVTEGASVIPASCLTADGVCRTNFVTSNFRPDDGRVTVVAFAQGEEAFDDLDGDNLYTAGEVFDDVGQVFVDKNESDALDPGEYLIGNASNNTWDGNTFIFASRLFTMSRSDVAPRIFDANPNGTCSNAPLTTSLVFQPSAANCRLTRAICIRDGNTNADAKGGNPIPAASTLTLTTTAVGATVSVDRSPVQSTNGPTLHVLTVERASCATALTAAGALDLSIKMPDPVDGTGATYKFAIGQVIP